MKKYTYLLVVAMLLLFAAGEIHAQVGKRAYMNIGWQFNGAFHNDFVQNVQGYGAYLQNGYYLTPLLAIGSFSHFSNNEQYLEKQTYPLENAAALTTDTQRNLYQNAFGPSLRLRLWPLEVQPYIEVKMGAEYAVASTYFSSYVLRATSWGFYVSPEIGVTYYPDPDSDAGLHLAVYYSYSTNTDADFHPHGLNNWGFKLGVAF